MPRIPLRLRPMIAVLLVFSILGGFGLSMTVSATDEAEKTALTDITPALTGASSGYTYRSISSHPIPNVYLSYLSGVSDQDVDRRVILDTDTVSLDINGTYALTAMDENAAVLSCGLSYSSANTAVAAVSFDGVITGRSTGTTTITVVNTIGNAKASCTVTVGTNVLPTEAATIAPTQPATQASTQAPTQAATTAVSETLSLSAATATVYKGCYHQLIATSNVTVSWKSSDTSIATVDSNGIVTAVAAGTATITAYTSTKSATCKITVKSGASVNLSNMSATTTAGKTLLLTSSTSSISWKSSNTAVATVTNGYVLTKSKGYAVITAYTSSGAATCLVTVKFAAPIRFAYASPNCAAKNQTVTLVAITDSLRTAVKFEVTEGSSTRTVTATSKTADGSNYIWKGTTTFSSAGSFDILAYSMYNSKWYSCVDAATTAFVVNSTSLSTTVCGTRRASDDVISMIATFEGFISSIYDDPITGDPTIGYGRVIYAGQTFYNGLTKNEAFAYLTQTVNNDGYATKVSQFFVNNSVKVNQNQFDALVCMVYNCGTGVLSSDDDLQGALLDCSDNTGTVAYYYINGSYVRIRTGPGTSYDIIKELDYGTRLSVLSTSNSAWYQVKLSDGTTGYVSSDYISKKTTGGNLDLNYVDKQKLINNFCCYHHAAGSCIWGLFYRRIDEMEIFFYGDYVASYGNYQYDISYTCATNSSYHT